MGSSSENMCPNVRRLPPIGDRRRPELHAEPLCALALCDIGDASEGDAQISGDHDEDFDDATGLLDKGVGGVRGDEFVDPFAQLVAYGGLIRAPGANVVTQGVRSEAPMRSGIFFRASLSTLSLSLGIMRWCSSNPPD